MPKVTLFNQSGSNVGEFELADHVFGIEPNTHVVQEAITMQRASLRQGTHKVKGRSEVRGGGRKPWRQKGTGRARQGSIRSPQWVGGGTVFGPTPRSYSFKLPKKVRRLALKSTLALKAQSDNVIVLEDLTLDAPKTKEIVALLNNLNVEGKAMIVTADQNDVVARSANNLENANVFTVEQVNVLDVVKHDTLIFTKDAAEKAGEVLA